MLFMARSAARAQTAFTLKGDAMNTAIKSIVTAAALAAATVGAVGTANARDYGENYAPNGHVPIWQQGNYAYGYGRYDRDAPRDVCRAPRWNPQTRYMPGDVVHRKGEVYQATRRSERVWNVNSPPEWTPNLWVEVRC
jgi:hypothetical protein